MSSSYWRQLYPNDIDIVEVESSDATESNLAGPGRVLGKLYESLGRRLEAVLSRIAERNGRGPRVIAMRIKNRVLQGTQRARDSTERERIIYTEEDKAGQRKDLKKLIRHAKSKTESTRKQALYSFVDLAFLDDQLVDFLNEMHATRSLKKQETWDFCDTSLQISSRMALACLQERSLFRLVKETTDGEVNSADALINFMRCNPEVSYLALRLINYRSHIKFCAVPVGKVFTTLCILEEIPDYIEWDEIDKMASIWFGYFYHLDGRYLSSESLWKILQIVKKLPRLAHSRGYTDWCKRLEKPDSGMAHHILGLLLGDESQNNKGLWWLRSKWMPFLDDADEALASIALSWGMRYDTNFQSDTNNLIAQCQKLASLCDSENGSSKQRALICIGVVLGRDSYSKSRMLDALSSTAFYRSAAYSALAPTQLRWTMVGITIYRHTNVKGQLIHLLSSHDKNSHKDCKDCSVESKLVYSVCNLIMMTATPPIIPKDVVPICAGILSNDKKAYVTKTPLGLFTFEGDRGETSLVGTGKIGIPILRFVPDGYPRLPNSHQLEEASKNCLDPSELEYKWVFERYIPHIVEKS